MAHLRHELTHEEDLKQMQHIEELPYIEQGMVHPQEPVYMSKELAGRSKQAMQVFPELANKQVTLGHIGQV